MGTPEQDQWVEAALGVMGLRSGPQPGNAAGSTPGGPPANANAPAGAAAGPGGLVIDEFGFDKADIPSAHLDELKALRDRLAASPDATVALTGNTDTVGKERYNKDLGLRRAAAVRDFLTSEGTVAAGRISIDSQGELSPAAGQGPAKRDPDQGEPNPKNRRVEVKVSGLTGGGGPDDKPPPQPPPPPKQPVGIPRLPKDYQVDPPEDPNSPTLDPRMNKPIPPPVKRGRSPLEWVNETFVDPAVDGVADKVGLSKEKREKLRKLAHEAVEKGATKGIEAGLTQLGLGGGDQDTIEKSIEDALKSNPNDPSKNTSQ